MYLHNRNGVWWQSEVEIVPGCKVRLDLQAEGAPGGIDSHVFFAGASELVTWARQAELDLRRSVVNKLFLGEYRAHPEPQCIRDRLAQLTPASVFSDLTLAMLLYFPRGSSDWTYKCTSLCERGSVAFMLNEEHEFQTPINVRFGG
jgi:hypothetical protein